MGQYEVLTWLQAELEKDADRFFTSREIYFGMREDGVPASYVSVCRCLFPLLTHGYVESVLTRGKGFAVSRSYRATTKKK